MGRLNWVWALGLVFTLTACSGGGGGGSSDTTGGSSSTDTSGDGSGDGSTTTVAINGFDFTLAEGAFWEFAWDYYSAYVAAGVNSTTDTSSHFRITLGAPVVKDGVNFYELLLTGNTRADDNEDLAPDVKYIGISGNKILALDATATTVTTLFDAQTGFWPGGGLFASFPSDTLFEATLGTIANDYINQAAYKVTESASTSQCEYYSGIGTICGGDYNQNLSEIEYYDADIGPLGLYSSYSISNSDWALTTTTNIGLTSASLRGDAVDYVLEVEPNNQVSEATAITLPAKVKGDATSETRLGGSTMVPLTMAIVTESEANDSPLTPQPVATLPAKISGDVLEGDANTPVSNLPGSSPGTPNSLEDWYKVTLDAPATLNAKLDFSGSVADLDLYVFTLSLDQTTLTGQVASYADNINDTHVYTESVSKSLAADTYYLAIDAYDTSTSGRVNYGLTVYTSDLAINVIDWFSFTLTQQTQLTISTSNGASFVVTNASGDVTYANGSSATPVALDAGSYLVGVAATGEYQLDIVTP